MPTFTKTKTFASGESPIASADLNSIGNDVASFLNTTKLDSDNIQDLGITAGKLAGSIGASKLSTTTPGYVLLGTTTTGVPTFTALSGDITVTGGGVTAIGSGKVTNTMLAGSITYAKLSLSDGDVPAAKIGTLADGKILIGNGSNVATAVTPSGDATVTNAGVVKNTGYTPTVTAKSGDYGLTAADSVTTFDATSADCTATLPTAVGIGGKVLTVIKIDSSSHKVTVARTSSQTINGSANDVVFYQPYQGAEFMSDGSNWVLTRWIGTRLLAKVTKTSNTTGTSGTVHTLTAVCPPLPLTFEIGAKYMFNGGVGANGCNHILTDGSSTQIAIASGTSPTQNDHTPAGARSDTKSYTGSQTFTASISSLANMNLTADSGSPAYIEIWVG